MKTFFTLTAIVAASLVATSSKAQEVYAEPAPAPVYQDEYAPPPGVVIDADFAYEFPGYAYYDYPAWNGHYRDYYYYAHYRPFFERRYGGRFQRGYVNRGYVNRGFAGRGGYAGHSGGYAGRGGGFAGHGGYGGGHGFAGHSGGGHGGGRR